MVNETFQNVLVGDAVKLLRTIPSGVFQCAVTSPPYWGLRDYGHPEQLGQEPIIEEYLERLVCVFAEVYRVMRDDGVLWLNIGDSYNAKPGQRKALDAAGNKQTTNSGSVGVPSRHVAGIAAKELCGIPWRLAFALQKWGWYLRCDCIWAKPNPMPESVRDRPTRAHEYVFLLTKRERYYWNEVGAKEPAIAAGRIPGGNKKVANTRNDANRDMRIPVAEKRNVRTVWNITPKPFRGAHFATFPPELVWRCLTLGAVGGNGPVLDPFCGSGTTLMVARELGLSGVGLELNTEYADMARARIAGVTV